jgi:peptidoglycan/LPS O-acetylase OafA/YrhL
MPSWKLPMSTQISTSGGPLKKGYEPALDGLRGVAILLVVAFHLGSRWTTGGFVGVDVFFVLSGFLITSRLVEEWDRCGTIHLKLFFARRALRLLPALFVLLVVGTTWARIFFPPELRDTTTRGAVSTALYIANWVNVRDGEYALGAFGHTWSLSVEEQFYALWPVLFIGLSRFKRRARTAMSASVGLSVYRIALLFSGASIWRLYNGFDTRCDGLILGAALAFAIAHDEVPESLKRIAPSVSLLGLGTMLLICGSITYQRHLTYVGVIPVVNVISAAAILTSLLHASSLVHRFLSLGVLRWFGRISYSLYLWHLPVLVACKYPPFHGDHQALGVLLSIVLASVSYYGIERPALRFKSHLQPNRRPTTLASR